MWTTPCYICDCQVIPDDIEVVIFNSQRICICLPCAIAIGKKEKVTDGYNN